MPTINTYDAVFINSGTRGLGEYVYNGVDSDSAHRRSPNQREYHGLCRGWPGILRRIGRQISSSISGQIAEPGQRKQAR